MIGSESTTENAPVPPTPPGSGRRPTRDLISYQSLEERLCIEASKAVCYDERHA